MATVPKFLLKVLRRRFAKYDFLVVVCIAHTNYAVEKFFEINVALPDKVIRSKLLLHHRELTTLNTRRLLNYLTL